MVFVPQWGTEGKLVRYNGVPTQGFGLASIVIANRQLAVTSAVTIATYLVDRTGQDGTFEVAGDVLITSGSNYSFSIKCDYTDEVGTARTFFFIPVQLVNVMKTDIDTVISQGGGNVPYTTASVTIRAKDNTNITVYTSGTFTSVVYNAEGTIKQIA